MWERISLVACMALLCGPAFAEVPDVVGIPAAELSAVESQPVRSVAGHWTIDYATGKVTPGGTALRAETVYDNRTTDSASAYVPDIPADPNRAVGDSLWMAGDGLLDWLEFSIWNSDTSAGSLSRVDVEIGLYDPNDVLLGTVTLDDVTIDPALAPGEVGIFTATDLQSLGINLPYACMYAMFFTDLQGGATGVGQALYDPPTVGESPDMFYEGPLDDLKLGQHNLYFESDPIANFYFAVGVDNPAQLQTIWDTGPTHTVVNAGTETWIGYTSGDYPGCDQRWAAMPFVIEDSGTTITEMLLWWWLIVPPDFDDMTADHVSYRIWHRTGLAAPTSFDEVFAEGEVGPYVEGGRDYRAKPYADWVPYHTHAVEIPIPVGDYYLTLYAEEGPGVDGHAMAWESGCNYVPEDLEQEFFWRSCGFPDPGFEEYAPVDIQPGPEMTDPDDRWNLAYVLRGTVATCSGDIDGDGDTDLADLAALLASYNKCVGDAGYNPAADFDDSGCVDLSDLASLLADYGCGT